MAQFSYARRAILWYHLMAPFYGMCAPGLRSGHTEGRICMIQQIIQGLKQQLECMFRATYRQFTPNHSVL